MRPDRWEHGSEFHWMEFDRTEEPRGGGPWGQDGIYHASGRDALRSLILHGMSERRWRQLRVPSYMCQTVIRSIASTGISLRAYDDDPRWPQPRIPDAAQEVGGAALVVNHFGIRKPPDVPYTGDVIEDHTHDPWSDWAHASHATFCFASLRKTLPLPDGAVSWSPCNAVLPNEPECTSEAILASSLRLAAALMKRRFLEGGSVEKDVYLDLFRRGEEVVGRDVPSGMTTWARGMLGTFPVLWWRMRRRAGWTALTGRLSTSNSVSVLAPATTGGVPYAVQIVMGDGAARDRAIARLAQRNVYSPVLWRVEPGSALPGTSTDTFELSRRLLTLHCDGRYDSDDFERVALEVTSVLE